MNKCVILVFHRMMFTNKVNFMTLTVLHSFVCCALYFHLVWVKLKKLCFKLMV